MDNLEALENKLGIKFNKKALLKKALVHRSYLNENKNTNTASNEKMEFLGDSILSLITSLYLYNNFPDLDEGIYTDIKAAIVRTESLHESALSLGLGEYLLLSKGEAKEGGRSNKSILADAFEALIAAIFLDGGFDASYDFVVKFLFTSKLKFIISNHLYSSSKNKLQEYYQSRFRLLPDYKILDETGPEHSKEYTIGVFFKDKLLARAVGRSKKEAEEKAAENAFKNLKI